MNTEMTTEKQLELSNQLLKELMSHLNSVDTDEDILKQEEIEDVNKSIEEYEIEINKLKDKLTDKENYKRIPSEFEVDNKPVIEEIIKDSIDKKRKNINNTIQECKKAQDREYKKLKGYNSIIEKLKEEIKNIEQRLAKDELAKKSNIVKSIHLSDEEVKNLKEEIEYRKSLIEEANKIIDLCAEEIRTNGQIITENNVRLQAVDKQQQYLDALDPERIIYPKSTIDVYALRFDKDNLAKLESGLKALKNRLQVLMYNPSDEIKKQIEENEKVLQSRNKEESSQALTNDDTKENNKEELSENRDNTINRIFMSTTSIPEVEQENITQVDPSSIKKDDDEIIKQDLNKIINNLFSDKQEVKKEEKINEEQEIEHKLEQPDEKIVNELRANAKKLELEEVEDAPEHLKEEKLSNNFKEKWSEWSKKISAAAVEVVYDVAHKIKKNQVDKNSFNKFDDINDNEEMEHKVLSSQGEYTLIKVNDEEHEYIKYGDKQDDVADGITIKYDGNDMHIYYPKTKRKSR